MSDLLLSVEGLSKRYCRNLRRSLRYGLQDAVAEVLGSARREGALRPGEFFALRDVAFELARGESLAVIGENGSGKSTLLKILYGLLKPDSGRVQVHGRTEAIIELGSGLDLLLTGRENVQLSAALHGFSGARARHHLDRVVDFAELADAIDAPVQSYSSGMRARLAFAIAAQLQPDLLLVDEVLAVGDIGFQRKCINHMRQYLADGGSLIFVSHNTFQVQAVCQRGLLLEEGRAAFTGSAVDTLNAMFERRATVEGLSYEGMSAGPVVVEAVIPEGAEPHLGATGQPLRLRVQYQAQERLEVIWGFSILTADRSLCITGDHHLAGVTIEQGRGELSCVIPKLPLLAGRYVVMASLADYGSGAALALGYAEHALEVKAPANRLTNAQAHFQQLVSIDVDWEAPAQTPEVRGKAC